MIHIKKSDGAALQPLLDAAKTKDNETVYRDEPVYLQIEKDFHEKCYLCEDNEVTSINIDHFEPHRNDLAKKYDWKNLFYSCGHCNNIKGAVWPLLNCTDAADQVWESIEIRFTTFPKTEVEILINPACPKPREAENTRLILEKTLAGKGKKAMQITQAKNLRNKMLRAHTELSKAIEKEDMATINKAVADNAAFAGMLRWYLKNDFPALFNQLEW